MARDVLTLIKSALYRANAQQIPSALVGSSDASALQLLHLFYSVGEELRALGPWPQLKRTMRIRLVPQQEGYTLPVDFFSFLPNTQYDGANSWTIEGPMNDADWNCRVIGTDFQGSTKAFRLFGYKTGYFKVSPVPGDGDALTVITGDYISKSWLQPPAWTASETIAQNIWRSAAGILYKKTDANSESTGTVMPTMEFGEGQDGECRLLALTAGAFATGTLYRAGEYFVAGGSRLYRVTVGGTSDASTAPTSTTEDTDINNGTLTVRYHAAGSWAGLTSVETGDHILISAQYYRYTQGGKTGKDQPNWTTTTVADGSCTMTHQDVAYEELVADTDVCAFDDEVVIAGLRAKLFQARGLGADDLVDQYERLKKTIRGRWNAGKMLYWAGRGEEILPNLAPTSNWTVQ